MHYIDKQLYVKNVLVPLLGTCMGRSEAVNVATVDVCTTRNQQIYKVSST